MTDVFLLILYFYNYKETFATILIESSMQGRRLINIGLAAIPHENIIPDVLAAHSITVYITTALYYGNVKNKAVKVLKRGHSLSSVGNLYTDLCDIKLEASTFTVACRRTSKCNKAFEAHGISR